MLLQSHFLTISDSLWRLPFPYVSNLKINRSLMLIRLMNNDNTTRYYKSMQSVIRQIMKMSGFVGFLLFGMCFSMALNVHAQTKQSGSEEKNPLRLGLLPHLSTPMTIKKYKPLIDYLEDELQRPIVFTTAPDYITYIHRAERGDFDLYLTAPNIAAYHEKHQHHYRVAKFTEKLQGVIVVTEDSPYQALDDLRGKTMATPDILALITLMGEITLLENNIVPGKDIHIKYTASHNNALQSVVKNEADAAMIGYTAYKIITSDSKLLKPVRILVKTRAVPHLMFMSPPSVSFQKQEKFKSALLKFTATGAGKEFFAAAPFGDIDVISDEDMKSLEGLSLILEQRLNN